jgi:hypothetical protein
LKIALACYSGGAEVVNSEVVGLAPGAKQKVFNAVAMIHLQKRDIRLLFYSSVS